MSKTETKICGKTISIDKSNGQGHCWLKVDASHIPADVREEIAAEIIDNDAEECNDYTASNGMHYRW